MTTLSRMICFCIGVLVASGGSPLPASGVDFYVSSTLGNDAWSGALPDPNGTGTDGPKRSTDAAQQLLNSTMGPGDRVLFRRGDTWTGTAPALNLSSAAGTPAEPIVVGAYGSGLMPRFDFTSTNSRPILQLWAGTSWLRFEDLHLTTSSAPGFRPYGVSVLGSNQVPVVHHLVFSRMIVEGLQYGFSLLANQTVIENCIVRNNFKYPAAGETGHSQGIYSGHADDLTLRDNRIENNGKPDSSFDHNIYVSGGYRAVIESNSIGGGLDGIKLRKTKETVVRRNTLSGLNLGAIGFGGDVEGGAANILIERNVIEDTINGIVLSAQSTTGDLDPGIDGVIIRNNVFRSPRVQGLGPQFSGQKGYIMFWRDYKIRNVEIYGNIFYDIVNRDGGLPRSAIYFQNPNVDPINVSVKNNIFHRPTADAALLLMERDSLFQSLELDNNLYHCSDCPLVAAGSARFFSLDALRAAYSGQEASGVVGDPLLAAPPDDLRLTAASALAIDRGANLPGMLDSDFEGRSRPQGASADIGPYEFSSGDPMLPMAPVLLPLE